ncbi:MAG: MFS transporter [Chloroflexi bacterium]|nr:MAG: MFS transporter [Chloroflexota bacterium]
MLNSRFERMRNNPLTLPFYLPSLLLAFSDGMLALILPLYVADFEISYGTIGLVLAASGAGQLIGDLPAGRVISRMNARTMMIQGLVVIILSTLVLFLLPSIAAILVSRFITGLGMAWFNVSRQAYATEKMILVKRGRAMSIFGGVNRIGKIPAAQLSGMIAGTFNIRAPFLLYCIVASIALYFIWRYAEDSTSIAAASTPDQPRTSYREALRANRQTIFAAGIGQVFIQMIRKGREDIIPLYASDVLGLDVETIGTIGSISSAIETTLFYPSGIVMDRFGRKYSIVPQFLVFAVGMMLIPLTTNFTTLLIVASAIGAANGLTSGTMKTMGADLATHLNHHEFLGLWQLIGDGGITLSPIVAGAVAQATVLGNASFIMASFGVAAALIFAFYVPETLRKPDTESAAIVSKAPSKV